MEQALNDVREWFCNNCYIDIYGDIREMTDNDKELLESYLRGTTYQVSYDYMSKRVIHWYDYDIKKWRMCRQDILNDLFEEEHGGMKMKKICVMDDYEVELYKDEKNKSCMRFSWVTSYSDGRKIKVELPKLDIENFSLNISNKNAPYMSRAFTYCVEGKETEITFRVPRNTDVHVIEQDITKYETLTVSEIEKRLGYKIKIVK